MDVIIWNKDSEYCRSLNTKRPIGRSYLSIGYRDMGQIRCTDEVRCKRFTEYLQAKKLIQLAKRVQ